MLIGQCLANAIIEYRKLYGRPFIHSAENPTEYWEARQKYWKKMGQK